MTFWSAGAGGIGGVEYDECLYNTAKANLEALNLDTKGIIYGDATQMDCELDEYNYFFMYNPFLGETFNKVIINIEKSVNRRERTCYLIYVAPVMHKEIQKHEKFKLINRIYTDYWYRKAFVYKIVR